MPDLITSYAAAARKAGVSARTISDWVTRGVLSAPPWTRRELTAAARKRTATKPQSAEHGTASRWRAGCDCDACRDAHNRDSRDRRRAGRGDALAETWPLLLEAVAAGVPLGQACANVGLAAASLGRVLRPHPDLRAQLDAALMDGRDPDTDHGTQGAYRAGCRCPECREAKTASRLR